MSSRLSLVCPTCRTELAQQDNQLVCGKCLAHYQLRDGIPSFAQNDYYWNEVTRQHMQEVIEVARTQGWQTAIYDVLKPEGSEVHATIGDERRADWRFLLPLTPESRVLDLGCGWGAAALALSKICDQVVAMDATWERISFLDIRRQQQAINNLYPIHGGDTLAFPFPNDYFDVVVLVGVLEWFGHSYPALSPREAQIKALTNLHDLLKPGGYLYIGIENRIGYDYLMGRPDHNGIPFVGLLPRRFADWVSMRKTGHPFRTYQYSKWGYRKLLQSAGFDQIQFYGDLPQYRHPHFYIPLNGGHAFEYFFTNLWELFTAWTISRSEDYPKAYRLANIGIDMAGKLRLTGLARHIVPGFSIIARRK